MKKIKSTLSIIFLAGILGGCSNMPSKPADQSLIFQPNSFKQYTTDADKDYVAAADILELPINVKRIYRADKEKMEYLPVDAAHVDISGIKFTVQGIDYKDYGINKRPYFFADKKSDGMTHSAMLGYAGGYNATYVLEFTSNDKVQAERAYDILEDLRKEINSRGK